MTDTAHRPTTRAARTSSRRDELQREVDRLGPWFHNLKLPDGEGGVVQTNPAHPFGDFPQFKWDQLAPHVPQDLSGKRCLDVGTNSGFYAFELIRRGASEVLAIDLDDNYLAQARFAADVLDMSDRVTFRNMQVYSLASLDEQFDVILFMGVLYHLRYPLLGLDVVRSKLADNGLLVFQTLTMPGEEALSPEETKDVNFVQRHRLAEPGWPKMAFFENGFAGDPTNWWAPSGAACEAMLRSSGLKIVGQPGDEMYLCTTDPDAYTGVPHLREAEYKAALTGLCG